jgi:hypothetical protein
MLRMSDMRAITQGSFVIDNAVTASVFCVPSISDNVDIHPAMQACATYQGLVVRLDRK